MSGRSGPPGTSARDAAARRLPRSTRALALLAAVLVSALAAQSASAVVVHLPDGRALSYQPLRRAVGPAPADGLFSNVEYNFGPVMASNTNYAFYWEPPGAPGYPPGYERGVDRYFRDLAHDSAGNQNVDSVSAQYNDASGEFASYDSHFGGAIIDTAPYPANGCRRAAICLTDAQIRAELAAYLTAHGLPMDLVHEYFFLPPPGVESCSEPAGRECSAGTSHAEYCAYHSSFEVGVQGLVIYSNDPYVTGIPECDDGNHPNANTADGQIEGGLTHEHNESITDPIPGSAWEDTLTGEEVGDKCNSNMGAALGTAPDGAAYNQVINGHLYWYEQVWSNQGHRCLQRLAFSGAEPTATFTATPQRHRTVAFDAGASTAPGGIAEYVWEFNYAPYSARRELSHEKTVATGAPTVSFTFPRVGSFEVGLTVFEHDGTSLGTARVVEVVR
jgi:hypothetical protein